MFQADWSDYGTKEQLEKKIGRHFKVRVGWTESKTDTVLCIQEPPLKPHEGKVGDPPYDHPRYRIYVWNQTGVRAYLGATLGAPVYTI